MARTPTLTYLAIRHLFLCARALPWALAGWRGSIPPPGGDAGLLPCATMAHFPRCQDCLRCPVHRGYGAAGGEWCDHQGRGPSPPQVKMEHIVGRKKYCDENMARKNLLSQKIADSIFLSHAAYQLSSIPRAFGRGCVAPPAKPLLFMSVAYRSGVRGVIHGIASPSMSGGSKVRADFASHSCSYRTDGRGPLLLFKGGGACSTA